LIIKQNDKYVGIWPVMLTPFDERNEIDWHSLERLIDWYLAAGVHGLFAICQSSEMFFLSNAEATQLSRFIVHYVDGRVPVVASGHTAAAMSQQADQLQGMADTGVDGVILISNRLASPQESDDRALDNLAWLTERVPASVDLGIYECPYPYKRLLSDEMVRWCATSGRYSFIKDTCCNLETLRHRVQLVAGSRVHIANANSQTLLESMKAGCSGFSGVMANFHPELYVWLFENWARSPQQAEKLSTYLSVAALTEHLDYPVCAKDYHLAKGRFSTANCRSCETNNYYSGHMQSGMQQMVLLGLDIQSHLQI
jgi:4-hydroxy-tetrahydrodipicolinate synthase